MPTALIIGTDHAFQRRQDCSKENEAIRNAFEKFMLTMIRERAIDAIAEEAGDDWEVWQHLKNQETSFQKEWGGLFAGTEIVQAPQPTVARSLAEARAVRHGDIRAVGAEKMTVGERDEAMAHMIVERFGDARSVLVVVGEDHRVEVTRMLNERGWKTESTRFPEQ